MMDKVLRPDKLEVDAQTPDAAAIYDFWERSVKNLIQSSFAESTEEEKLFVLTQYLTYKTFPIIKEAKKYSEALLLLQKHFIKPKNISFARYLLYNRKQKTEESVSEYVTSLRQLAKDGKYEAVTAQVHQDEAIRDSLISGLKSNQIRQRILEQDVTLNQAIEMAQSLEAAQINAESINMPSYTAAVSGYNSLNPNQASDNKVNNSYKQEIDDKSEDSTLAAATSNCWNCGRSRHPRRLCPAKDATCNKCSRRGHFAKQCREGAPPPNKKYSNAILASTSSCKDLRPSLMKILVNGKIAEAMVDTGSSDTFMSESYQKKHQLEKHHMYSEVSLASSPHVVKICGYVLADLEVNQRHYNNIKIQVLPGCITDVILGKDFQKMHKQVTFHLEGSLPPLEVCGAAVKSLTTWRTKPPELFANLSPDCHPVRDKSRRYSQEDKDFIAKEVQRLETEGIIVRSNSPWRAQCLVVKDKGKKRLAIDYSHTINKFTHVDAYPLPSIPELLNNIASYKYYSQIDLRAAYHQIKIRVQDQPPTAFEANGRLYHFTRLPFGVTNGVAIFQRKMDEFVEDNGLAGVFPYMDDVTVCGHDKEDHDLNLEKFLTAARKANLTLNEDKCTYSTTKISLLGRVIEHGMIKPDPERLKPLQQMPVPHDMKSLKRAQGFFSYYSTWIPSFSRKLRPLIKDNQFPLGPEAVTAFNQLKKEVEEAVVAAIDETLPFTLETDASDGAIAATLNQAGRPVAFFSRTLHGHELNTASIEKEALSIVEAVCNWRHLLARKHFTIKTDQKSVSYIFDAKHRNKIKNEKIARWRLELSVYDFDIQYKPGPENIPPDTLSRSYCSTTSGKLYQLHDQLCHPGITRLFHYTRSKNLPFSIEEIRSVIQNCKVCCEEKPRFHKPEKAHLIKSTTPFERINVDFKGPLPTTNQNCYFLQVIDEYSRFPFVFPCKDTKTETVKKHLCQLFSIFGYPSFIHSDRGSSFLSKDLQDFLLERGIAASRTTPYRPQANGQVERSNSTIWKAVRLSLRSKNLPMSQWQEVLPEVLHSIRSLLCTATNQTPHERFLSFTRRSATGSSVPSWLMNPGGVLLRKYNRSSKNDPYVEEVELLQSNPQYAHIRYADGRESTVSVQDLAPTGSSRDSSEGSASQIHPDPPEPVSPNETLSSEEPAVFNNSESNDLNHQAEVPLRRSSRIRKPNPKYDDFICDG